MKATRINAKQAQGLINNEEERFNNQPAIINNGDSKETSISYEGKTIKIKCLLSNTKACKWDKKYPDLQDILYKNEYSNKNDFCKEEGNVPILWSALCKHENKYNRVFEGVDIYELANNLRETFDF